MKTNILACTLLFCFGLQAQNGNANKRDAWWLQNQSVPIGSGAQIYNSAELPNVGQTAHSARINVTMTGPPTSWLFSASIQGSQDGVSWVSIGPAIISRSYSTGAQSVQLVGWGSYPHLRCSATFTPHPSATSFVANAFYTGTVASPFVLSDLTGPAAQMSQYGPYQSFPASAGTYDVVTNPGNLYLTVYSMFLVMTSGVTSLRVQCQPSAIDIVYFNTTTGLANVPITWPAAVRPYVSCLPGDRLRLIYTGTPGDSTITLGYRFE